MDEHDIDEMGREWLAAALERMERDPVKIWDPLAAAIASDIERGGPIGRAMQRAFGLHRQGV